MFYGGIWKNIPKSSNTHLIQADLLQTGEMPIWVIAAWSGHFVGFVACWIIWFMTMMHIVQSFCKWATTWQNQQTECAYSKDSDQPGHPPSLIRVFAVRMKKPWVLSYPLSAQRRLWSDWADAQADLSLRWARTHFVSFVMSGLKCSLRSLWSKG